MNIKNNQKIQTYISAVSAENQRRVSEGDSRRYRIITFGCQQNEADSEKIAGLLESMGYTPLEGDGEAEIVIVNTCAVREHAESRALSMIGELKHRKAERPDMIIGVVGCMAARESRSEQLKHRYANVDFALEPNSEYMIAELVYKRLFDKKYKRTFIHTEQEITLCEGMDSVRRDRHRAWVSVMYGCNNFCAYCIVPYVRGRERSRRREDIIAEVKTLVIEGCHEITLLGQNVNSYRDGECDFASLLEEIVSLDGDFIVRFMTSHPKDVSERLIEVVTRPDSKVETHFHLPLQSGSDRILHSMNRRYTVEKYLATVAKLRERMPDIVLTTDIIVGYPTETEEEFEQTVSILERVKFDMVYSFIYSVREGTPASRMEQVDEAVKSERFLRMLKLQDEISLERNKTLTGETLRVLVDGVSDNKERLLTARTRSGKLVHLEGDDALIGSFVNVKIQRAGAYVLYAELVE